MAFTFKRKILNESLISVTWTDAQRFIYFLLQSVGNKEAFSISRIGLLCFY